MENKYFTIYWINGDRNVIQGPTIETAFTNAGYGAGAISAVDWYDDGVSETHYWDKDSHNWIKFEPIRIHFENDLWSKSFQEVKDQLVNWLIKHQTIIVDFQDQTLELSIVHQAWKSQYIKQIFLTYRFQNKETPLLIIIPYNSETFQQFRLEDSCKALYERVKNGGIGRSSVPNDLISDIVLKQNDTQY